MLRNFYAYFQPCSDEGVRLSFRRCSGILYKSIEREPRNVIMDDLYGFRGYILYISGFYILLCWMGGIPLICGLYFKMANSGSGISCSKVLGCLFNCTCGINSVLYLGHYAPRFIVFIGCTNNDVVAFHQCFNKR
jgi:hypothetical protein